jgi:hypothetical protein
MVSTVKTALPGLTAAGQIVVLTGADCYQTSAMVAREIKAKLGKVDRVVIAPSDSYAAEAAVSAVAAGEKWPVLLTPSAGPFPASSAKAITDIGATSGLEVGTSASPGVAGFTVIKVIKGTASAGDPDGRYDLSGQLDCYLRYQGLSNFAHFGLVSGANYQGALVLGAYLARDRGVLLLTTSSSLSSAADWTLRVRGPEIKQIDFMALGWPIYRQVKSLNSPRVTQLSVRTGAPSGGNSLTVTGSALGTVTSIRVGSSNVQSSNWKATSSTSLAISSVPPSYGSGPVEVIATNYWGDSPASTNDLYWYSDGSRYPGDKIVQAAVKYLGVPYLWGGASPTYGFDCSGLVMYVYSKFGIYLPHYAAYQATYGTAVTSQADLVPGDLVFFYTPIEHVGIYVGGGMMINAPKSGDLVTITNAFRTGYVTARRLIPYSSPYSHYEQTDSRLTYNGTWTTVSTSLASNASFAYANSPGSSVIVKFTGTSLNWIAKKSPVYGIAKVTVDGGTPTYVDLYSAAIQWQQKVWTTGLLPSGTHIVKIEWTGTKNAAATDTNIGLDAVEVIGSLTQAPSIVGANRYEQSDSRLAYAGTWTVWNTGYVSGGSCKYSNLTGASVTVNFTGTCLSWIGIKGPLYGKASVSVDGGTAQLVDLYSPSSVFRTSVWNTGTLASGTHTVKIIWTGTKNPSATNTYIGVDAFDVVGTLN